MILEFEMDLRRALSSCLDPERAFKRDLSRMFKLRSRGNKIGVKIMRRRIIYKFGCYISPEAELSPDIDYPHPSGIVIGRGVKISDGCTIYQNVTIGVKSKTSSAYPNIENDCVIYAGAKIIGPVVLKAGSCVGANAVVLPSSPCGKNNDTLVGIPAKSVRAKAGRSGDE